MVVAMHFNAGLNWLHLLSLAAGTTSATRSWPALGWQEETNWEEGLAKTINWYLEHGFGSWWVGDVDAALAAHPKAQ